MLVAVWMFMSVVRFCHRLLRWNYSPFLFFNKCGVPVGDKPPDYTCNLERLMQLCKCVCLVYVPKCICVCTWDNAFRDKEGCFLREALCFLQIAQNIQWSQHSITCKTALNWFGSPTMSRRLVFVISALDLMPNMNNVHWFCPLM